MTCKRAGLLLAALLFAAGPAAAAEPPQQPLRLTAGPFLVEAEPGLRLHAERIAAQAPDLARSLAAELGLPEPASGTIILIASEKPGGAFHDLAEAMPEWAAGQTFGHSATILLRLDRMGSYGQRDAGVVLAHELTHLVLASALPEKGQELPRWFNEGTASALSGESEWRDSWYVWISSLASASYPYGALDAAFDASGGTREEAYAGSLAAVRFLRRSYGRDVLKRILSGVRSGSSFRDAFRRAAGVSLLTAEAAWGRELARPRRWIMWIGSALTLWIGASVLILVAYAVKRARGRRIMETWEPEEPPPYRGDAGEADDDSGETIH